MSDERLKAVSPQARLENKLWRVEVVDVVNGRDRGADGKPRPLAESQQYSKIGAILERLA